MFASDGAGEGYAFDTRVASGAVMQVPFIGMRYATLVAPSFDAFLEALRGQEQVPHQPSDLDGE
jgi:hypothetical protein